MDSVLSCMVSDEIGQGRLSAELSSAVSGYLGRAGGVALREHSRAVELVFAELELQPGDVIGLSPFLDGVYLEVAGAMGLEVVLFGVDPARGVVEAEAVEETIRDNPAIKALVVDTSLGRIPDMDRLVDTDVALVEDVSEGLGANTGEKKCGAYGGFTIVGLEQHHVITAGGGALALAAKRNAAAGLKRRADEKVGIRLADMNASLGITQIKALESFIARRAEIAAVFGQAVAMGKHKTLIHDGDGENVFFGFPIIAETGLKEIVAYARRHGVEVEPAYAGTIAARLLEDAEPDSPHARSDAANMVRRCALFPLYPMMNRESIETVRRVLSSLP